MAPPISPDAPVIATEVIGLAFPLSEVDVDNPFQNDPIIIKRFELVCPALL